MITRNTMTVLLNKIKRGVIHIEEASLFDLMLANSNTVFLEGKPSKKLKFKTKNEIDMADACFLDGYKCYKLINE